MLRARSSASLSAVVLVGLAAVGCDQPGAADSVPIYLVDADGQNPASECGDGVLNVRVDQGEGHVKLGTSAVSGGTFDLPVTIDSYAAATLIDAELECEDATLRGVSAPHVPLYAGFVSVVMGVPGTCRTLAEPELASAHVSPAVVANDASLLVVGGLARGATGGEISTDTIGFVNAVQLGYENALLDDLTLSSGRDLREAQAARLGSTSEIVILSGEDAFRFDLNVESTTREFDVELHAGGGGRSALVDLGVDGVAIVGGEASGARVDGITWVTTSGAVQTTRLATPRAGATAIALGAGVLVAGGQAEGEPPLELVRVRGEAVALDASAEAFEGAQIVRDFDRGRALVLGGADGDGAARTATFLVSACEATGCTVEEGPQWAAARLAPAIAETGESTFLVGGTESADAASVRVERVVFGVDGAPSFESFGDLPTGRDRAGAAHVRGGLVVVAGGRDEDGNPARSLFVCWEPRDF